MPPRGASSPTYWPPVHGRELPEVLDSKLAIPVPSADSFPAATGSRRRRTWLMRSSGPRFAGIAPRPIEPEREPPVPKDVFTSFWRSYEAAKARSNRIDFEDMLTLAVELYESDQDAIGLVRKRDGWFSVDEYQDTNRLQEDLLGCGSAIGATCASSATPTRRSTASPAPAATT